MRSGPVLAQITSAADSVDHLVGAARMQTGIGHPTNSVTFDSPGTRARSRRPRRCSAPAGL
jgi:hypothetical protein